MENQNQQLVELKKKVLKIVAIAGAVAAGLLAIIALLREILGGRMTKDNLEEMRKGFNEDSKKNAEVVKKSLNQMELQHKLVKKRTEAVQNMTIKEQEALAKKLGV